MARRWWPFGGKSGTAEHSAGDSPAPAVGSEQRTPDVSVAATVALQRQPDSAPSPPAARGGRPAGDDPTAADARTGLEFRRELASDLWTNSRPGLLGDDGGLGETAVFLREATGIADDILSKPIAQEVLRTVDTRFQSADGNFANSLPTLMSYANTDALMSGEPLDMPFGDRQPQELFADRAASDVELPRFGPAQPPPPPVALNVATGRREPAQPGVAAHGLMRTPDTEIELPRGRPRRFEESPGRERGAAPETPLVVRSVPAREFREGGGSGSTEPINRLPDAGHPPVPLPTVPNDISGTVASIETFRGPRPAARTYAPETASDIPRSAPSAGQGAGSPAGAPAAPSTAAIRRTPTETPPFEPQVESTAAVERLVDVPDLPLVRETAPEGASATENTPLSPQAPGAGMAPLELELAPEVEATADAPLSPQAPGEGMSPLELELARPAGSGEPNGVGGLQEPADSGNTPAVQPPTIARLTDPVAPPSSSATPEAAAASLPAESRESAVEGETRLGNTSAEGGHSVIETALGEPRPASDAAVALPATEVEDQAVDRTASDPGARHAGSGFDELAMPFTEQRGETSADTAEASTQAIARHVDTTAAASSLDAPVTGGSGIPEPRPQPQPLADQTSNVLAVPPHAASTAAAAALEEPAGGNQPGELTGASVTSHAAEAPGSDGESRDAETGGMISRLVADAQPEAGTPTDGGPPQAPISAEADTAAAYAPLDLEMAEPPGERAPHTGADATVPVPPVTPMDQAIEDAGSGTPTPASAAHSSATHDASERSIARLDDTSADFPITAAEDTPAMAGRTSEAEAISPQGALQRQTVSPAAASGDTFAAMPLPLAERGERGPTPGDGQEAGAPQQAQADGHSMASSAPTSVPSTAGEAVARVAERAADVPLSRTAGRSVSAASAPSGTSTVSGQEAPAGANPEASLPFATPDGSGSMPGPDTGDAGAPVAPIGPRGESAERPTLEFASAGEVVRSTGTADSSPEAAPFETVREGGTGSVEADDLPFAAVQRRPDTSVPLAESAAAPQSAHAAWSTPELPHAVPQPDSEQLSTRGARSTAGGASTGSVELPGLQRKVSPGASSGAVASAPPTATASAAVGGPTQPAQTAPDFVMRRAEGREPAPGTAMPVGGGPGAETELPRAMASPQRPDSAPTLGNAGPELPLAREGTELMREVDPARGRGSDGSSPTANSADPWLPLPLAEPDVSMPAAFESNGSQGPDPYRGVGTADDRPARPIAYASGGEPVRGPAVVHRATAAPSIWRLADGQQAPDSAASLPLTTVSPTAPETLSHAPVAMPLATPPHAVQRAVSGGTTPHEATGMIVERDVDPTSDSTEGDQESRLSIEEIKEQVWQHIRRELRIERERSRGYT